MLWMEYLFFLCFVIKFSTSSVPDLPFCLWDHDCSTNNTVCVNSSCQCTKGFIYSADRTKCLEVVNNYGAICEESQQCSAYLLAGGTCKKGFCACTSGYHYLHGKCWKSSKIDEQCSLSDNCYVNFDVGAGTCRDGICECSHGYYRREYRSCRRRAKVQGDDCAIDHDCQYNSSKNITCNKSKKCIESSDTSQINPSQVNKDLIEADNKYKKTIGINLDNLPNQTKEIFCQRAYFYSEENQKCVAEIGEPCKLDEEPLIKNSICIDNYWKCKVAFVPTINNRFCRKATTVFGKSCLLDEQCYLFGPDAVCKFQQCVCNSKSHFVEEELFCWTTKQPGDKCRLNYDCDDGRLQIGSRCINNTCTCPDGYHPNSKNHCVQDVKAVGDKCSEPADCKQLPKTNCIKNVCSCVDFYYEESGKCVPGINTPCDNSTACKPKNSYCENELCICEDDFVAASTGLCVPMAAHGVNCTYTVQCMALDPHSHCQAEKQICSCLDTYYYNYGRCFKRKVLGEHCENIAECYVKSPPSTVVCKNGVCKCDSLEQFDETYCGNHSTTILMSTWILVTITISKLII